MKLEEYIARHKASFEEDVPGEPWQKIRQRLPRRRFLPVLRYAAAVLVFLAVGYLMGLKTASRQNPAPESYDAALLTYTRKVDQKKARLETLVSNQPDLEETFSRDLSDLQQDFEDLKAQLAGNPNRQALINAMIKNLEWQIELLNQQTKIAEKQSQNYL